jgi:hypothetical protein
VRDVVHEDGCRFEAEDGTAAETWVFAPPVTAAQAAVLARRASTAEGCRALPDAPAFGRSSVATVCDTADGATVTSFRGLFGDAWLTCSLTVPATAPEQEALAERTGRWCAAVAQTGAAG